MGADVALPSLIVCYRFVWILVCVRVVSRCGFFHSWVARIFDPGGAAVWVSQIECGDRYSRSTELEEQISRQVAVVVAGGTLAGCDVF